MSLNLEGKHELRLCDHKFKDEKDNCTQEFDLIHYARAFLIDYNSSLGGPSGGVSLSASMLFTCTRNSSTLERGIKYQAFVNNL